MPSSSERYHQLLLPALQLVTCLLISLGSESGLATREVRANLYSSQPIRSANFANVARLPKGFELYQLTARDDYGMHSVGGDAVI
jgi:hypothetical protein